MAPKVGGYMGVVARKAIRQNKVGVVLLAGGALRDRESLEHGDTKENQNTFSLFVSI